MPHHSIESITELIAAGNLTKAVAAALSLFPDKTSQTTLRVLQGRNAHNEEQHLLGTDDNREYLQERNKITVALTKFLAETPLPKKSLTNAPLKPDSHFIGRETELAEIRKRFEANEMLMLVNGEGGIGKTTLASKYWHDYEKDYTHLAYVFCEGDIRDDIRNKLALPLRIEVQQIGEDKLLAVIIETMAAYPKPCLLILDNANDSKHIIDFRDTSKEIGWHILITSRCQKVLPKEQEIAIHHLPPAQAKALFLQHYTEDSPDFDNLLDKLLLAVGYNTLCVEIFAKTLFEIAPFGETIESLLADIQEKGMYLGEKSFEIHTNYTDYIHKKATKSDEILEILYDIARLNEVEKTLLLRFALLPPENHEAAFLVSLFTPENAFQFGQELISLAKKGWLTTNTKTYRLSPVIQRLLLAKEKENIWKAAALIIDNVNEKLKDNSGVIILPLHEAQPYSLVAESLIENIQKNNSDILLLKSNLSNYYLNIGYLNMAIELLNQNMIIYINKKEERNYNTCYLRLGNIYIMTHEHSKAIEYYKKYIELSKKRYEANRYLEVRKYDLAVAYEKQGDIAKLETEFNSASFFYQEAITLLDFLSKNYPTNFLHKSQLAIIYEKMGFLYELKYNLENALSFYLLYHELIKNISDNNTSVKYKFDLALSYLRLGKLHTLKKESIEATFYYDKSFELMNELNKINPYSIQLKYYSSIYYYNRGKLSNILKGIKETKSYFVIAKEILEELVLKVPDIVKYKEKLQEIKKALKKMG